MNRKNNTYNIRYPVYLASEHSSRLNGFLEFLLGKWQWIKNDPRGNYILLRSLWITLIPIGCLFLLWLILYYVTQLLETGCVCKNMFFGDYFNDGIFTIKTFNIVIGFFGTFMIINWNLWKDYHNKWKYCCDLYNNMLTQDDETFQCLRIALAIDLLTVDLWAHRSFAEMFRDILEESIEETCSQLDKESYFNSLNNKQLTESIALRLLENYQKIDLDSEDEQ